jgi:glycosyltransferase involved in cell wall biosynthesis
MKKDMKVSILTITYNHSEYISQAIESFLMQKTDFAFEVIIADDASTDNNQEIIRSFQQKYPNIIKPILRNENIGMNQNFVDAVNHCSGKYIALCEGDDYWTDPLKLQKQVDFLEANEDYGLICTNYDKYFQDIGLLKRGVFTKYKNNISYDAYLLDRSSIGTQTVLIKNGIIKDYFNEVGLNRISSWIVGDTSIWLYAAIKYKIKVLNESTAVYRILNNSACHFESAEKHLAFVKKGLEIPQYFISRYGAMDETIKKFNRRVILVDLAYAYKIVDKKIASMAWDKLKTIGGCTLKERLLYIGAQNKILKAITERLFNFYNYIKNK